MPQLAVSPKCQGHGLCYGTFPNLFTPDDEGFAIATTTTIPAADAALATSCCPEAAITIIEPPTDSA